MLGLVLPCYYNSILLVLHAKTRKLHLPVLRGAGARIGLWLCARSLPFGFTHHAIAFLP